MSLLISHGIISFQLLIYYHNYPIIVLHDFVRTMQTADECMVNSSKLSPVTLITLTDGHSVLFLSRLSIDLDLSEEDNKIDYAAILGLFGLADGHGLVRGRGGAQ